MQMTDQEIIASYQQAKNKSKQIQILAELNACGWEAIADILKSGGIAFRPKKKNIGKNGIPWTKEETETVLAMRFEENRSIQEIADRLGRDASSVRAYIYRLKKK